MTADTRPTDGPAPLLLLLCEAALVLVHLSVVAGFARLFEDRTFFAPLALIVVVAHLLAILCRRHRIPAPLVAVIAGLAGALTITWLLFAHSTAFGLPTTDTWHLALDALRQARPDFRSIVAPAPVTAGFVLISAMALTFAVWFSDWAAFRLRATVEAVVPATVIFVFASLLGSGQYEVISTLGFAAAVLLFVLTHKALRAEADHAWLTTSSWAGPRAVVRAGAALVLVGLVAGAVVGPRLPGASADPLMTWRSGARGTGDRSTVSPIVDLRKRLVNQSDTVLFRVRADRRTYWRLTALDRFDGTLWSSDNEFGAVDGGLPSSNPEGSAGRRNRQQYDIRALSTIWAPAAYESRRVVDTSADLRWDPESSTLIIDAEDDTDGIDYEVISEAPAVDPDVLSLRGRQADPLDDRYLELPGDFPEVALVTAQQVVAGASDRYAASLALQTYFRSQFTYSLDVEPGHGDDALVEFLDSRQGYCEQFAGAFAAMGRAVGLPTRVAVGFTPGDVDPDDPQVFTVRGRHAHAWPEVHFSGLGWVPFEPTPGRGLPDAENYTGVAEQQDDERGVAQQPESTTTAPTDTSAPGPSTTAAPTTAPRDQEVRAGALGDGDDGGPSSTDPLVVAAVVLGVGLAAWLLIVLAVPAMRRRRNPTSSAVLDAWHRALGPVRWLTRSRPASTETHVEFARRIGAEQPLLASPLGELAILATDAAWRPTAPTAAEGSRAAALADELHAQVDERQTWRTRMIRRLSWREAFER